jgi:hypothetical protein
MDWSGSQVTVHFFCKQFSLNVCLTVVKLGTKKVIRLNLGITADSVMQDVACTCNKFHMHGLLPLGRKHLPAPKTKL